MYIIISKDDPEVIKCETYDRLVDLVLDDYNGPYEVQSWVYAIVEITGEKVNQIDPDELCAEANGERGAERQYVKDASSLAGRL